ncbi:PHP family phosphohydrolase, histidinol phosphatase [Halobacteroides halobius DSM 5150]|uniref:PHP family phosphohydrolase, histidinol phosphatase n=1 Tax=Halobacteroides halobius (strain ATCC 35273 / DSM 5150 / MD-1) TaxID=748449 RepID=L0KCA0_HALHC|nr:PHP domain-containing protein [Halobacteroides halobius]AGB41999.1 PHP family phosphohydrolase, histidinol phosphatase [Halobacteroides halobius DSM 5150]
MEVYADYHTHTHHSHGQGTIRENIEAAIEQGLEEIAIADHGPASHSLVKLGVEDAVTLLEIKKKVEKYDRLYPEIKVLSAVEANVVSLEGELDVPNFILKELDKVLVGFHLFVKPASWRDAVGIIFNNLVLEQVGIKQEEIRYQNTELLIKVMNNYDIDIITHPGYQINIDTVTLAQKAAKHNVALEINTKHLPKKEYIKKAAAQGVKFSLGSDAHKPKRVGDVKDSLAIAKQIGLTADRIINVK